MAPIVVPPRTIRAVAANAAFRLLRATNAAITVIAMPRMWFREKARKRMRIDGSVHDHVTRNGTVPSTASATQMQSVASAG
ncbi:hypothetical protein GCM10022140_55550 [Rhodococcus aetherivorans]